MLQTMDSIPFQVKNTHWVTLARGRDGWERCWLHIEHFGATADTAVLPAFCNQYVSITSIDRSLIFKTEWGASASKLSQLRHNKNILMSTILMLMLLVE